MGRGAGVFSLVVGSYGGLNCFAKRLRGKNDWINCAVAGFFSTHVLSDRLVRVRVLVVCVFIHHACVAVLVCCALE